jgi:hypothetical protein
MSLPHGSFIPGTLEGAPFHNDNFQLSFNTEANATPTLVFVGAAVTLATDAGFTVKVTHADTDFLLGVAMTSGQLSAAVDVICRGWVQVYTDSNVTAGDLLYSSNSTDGMVGNLAGATQSRAIALESVNGSVTPALINILIF